MYLPVSSALLIALINGAHNVFAVTTHAAEDESAEGKITQNE